MVELIGLGTMGMLIWLIVWSMAGESESEKRRNVMKPESRQAETGKIQAKYAA
jgi:hypothetical protein